MRELRSKLFDLQRDCEEEKVGRENKQDSELPPTSARQEDCAGDSAERLLSFVSMQEPRM